MIKSELKELSGGLLQYETGGYRVQYDTPRPAFKQNNNRNNNNRNFKGTQGNNQPQSGQPRQNNFRDRDAAGGAQGGNSGNGYNNKFKNNNNKFKNKNNKNNG
jgi:hypothetical protein